MKRYFSLLLLLSCTLLSLVIVSCDSPTGNEIDTDERPEIPTMQEIEMDVSYFRDNLPPEDQAQNEVYTAYLEARALAIELDEELNGRLEELVEFQTYGADNGGGHPIQHLWRWLYTFDFDYDPVEKNDFMDFFLGIIEVLVLAENNENTQMVSWEVFVSGCIEEDEDNPSDDICFDLGVEGAADTYAFLVEHKLMDGEVSFDLSTGKWNLYLPSYSESEPEYLNLEWNFETEQIKTFKTVFTFDAFILLDLTYSQNNEDYRIEQKNSNSVKTITWDSETGEGSIETEGVTKACWGSDLKETACL